RAFCRSRAACLRGEGGTGAREAGGRARARRSRRGTGARRLHLRRKDGARGRRRGRYNETSVCAGRFVMRPAPLDIGTIHFVGIGGIGMSGIAEVMHNLGYKIRGSDVSDSANVKRLRRLGIEV